MLLVKGRRSSGRLYNPCARCIMLCFGAAGGYRATSGASIFWSAGDGP